MANTAMDNPLMDPPHPKFEKERDLSRGAFGFVQLCKNKQTGEFVAIKFIERGDKITANVMREVINLRVLGGHPHIIEFREVFLTRCYLAIVMEYGSEGDLFRFTKSRLRLTEEYARWFFQQLIVSVDYCHRMGVVNRDIKLENTLLAKNPWNSVMPLAKICDFGFSKHSSLDSGPKSIVGTAAYLAPEVLNVRRGQTYDGKMADVWSCGVMFYGMLVGGYPFERVEDRTGETRQAANMIMRILALDYHIPPGLSEPCKDLIRRILVLDPAKRITIQQIYQHPWFIQSLPPGVVEMNAQPYPPPEGLQTVEEIKRIVGEARLKEGCQRGPTAGTDALIDSVLNNMGLVERSPTP